MGHPRKGWGTRYTEDIHLLFRSFGFGNRYFRR